MKADIELFKSELKQLIKEGYDLYYSLAVSFNKIPEKHMQKISKLKLPNFNQNYEQWYSKSVATIKQILPERLDDFVKLYKNEKRKEVDFLTYTISDCLLGVEVKRGYEIKADGSAAIQKLFQQIQILDAVEKRFESKLFDIVHIVQADLFDSELDSALELSQKGFLRGAGAISGVVLEKHLNSVCVNHKISVKKSNPSISDFNDALKKEEIIETAIWRFIQHLGDLRNLCDHNKKREPKKDEVDELIHGVQKILKTLF